MCGEFEVVMLGAVVDDTVVRPRTGCAPVEGRIARRGEQRSALAHDEASEDRRCGEAGLEPCLLLVVQIIFYVQTD